MGYLLVVLAACCWAMIGPVGRFPLAEGVGPLEIAFWRAALGGGLFAAHALGGRKAPVARRDLPAVAAFGLLGVAVFFAAYMLAVERGGAALASVLLYTAPAWVALMSALWLAERITTRKLVAVGLTITGVAGIALGGAATVTFAPAAIGWGLLSGACYALYYPFGKRFFARYSPASVFAVALPVGAAGLAPWVEFADKSLAAWVAIAFLGVVSTFVAYLLYGLGLRRIEATRASVVATVEPLVAASAAYLWWGERLGVHGAVGAALVLTGVVLSVSGEAPGPADRPGSD